MKRIALPIFFLILLSSQIPMVRAPNKTDPDLIIIDDDLGPMNLSERIIVVEKELKTQRYENVQVLANNPITYFDYLGEYIPYPPKFFSLEYSHNPGYGEDSEALGQFVDNYEDLGNVSVNYETVNNATLECMELNFSRWAVNWTGVSLSDYFESFPTGWTTAQGGSGVIGKSSSQKWNGSFSVLIDAPLIASYCYGYRGFSAINGDAVTSLWVFPDDITEPDYEHVIGLYDTVAGAYLWELRLEYHDSGYWLQNDIANSGTDIVEVDPDVWVNVIVYFNDTSDKVTYYIDGRDSGEFTPNNAAANPNRVYIGDTWGAGWKGAYFLDDMIIGEGDIIENYVREGYFISTDYLADSIANGMILVQMTNVTIPTDTGITIEFSVDNSTWVNNLGASGFNTITDGFLSLDLRNLNYSTGYYIRVNMTTDDTALTPRIFQSRLITTEGIQTISTTVLDTDFPWVALAIILSLIAALLFNRRK